MPTRASAPPAAVLLGFTPALFGRAGLARLDNLLLPLALEIGLAWWRPATGRFAAARTVGRVCVLGALSVLVKGPFGLLVVGAGAVARAMVDRRWQPLLLGGLAGVLSLVPAGLFLAWDRAHGGTFFEGYVQAQLLASLTGARTDGSTFLLFPFLSTAARFEPFFLLALLGGAWALGRGRSEEPSDVAEQRGDARFVAWLVLAGLSALCLPSRKIWNHALPVYPLLALLAGAGWAHLASQPRWATWTGRLRTWGPLVVAAVAVVAALRRPRARRQVGALCRASRGGGSSRRAGRRVRDRGEGAPPVEPAGHPRERVRPTSVARREPRGGARHLSHPLVFGSHKAEDLVEEGH